MHKRPQCSKFHSFKDATEDQIINRIFHHIDFSEIACKTYKIKSLHVPCSFTLQSRKSVLNNSLVR
jgi:hypothetical protein